MSKMSSYPRTSMLAIATLQLSACCADAFVSPSSSAQNVWKWSIENYAFSSTALFSTPPRQPRRNLKKRPRKRDRRGGSMLQVPDIAPSPEQPNEQSEWRPLTKSRAVEAGEDYWIDETELRRVQERERALKNRQLAVGEIPKEKLREEVVAPYKQNWIGWFSVGIVMIATIVSQFPELLDNPAIPIPDL